MGYQILPHTADARIRVEGKDLEEIFASALEGMNELLKPGFCQRHAEFPLKMNTDLDAPDLTILLIDFLSRVLTKSHEDQAIYCKAAFKKLIRQHLAVEIYGAKVEGFDEDIKAVTYHEAEVKKNEEGEWESIIVFDI